MPHNFETFHKIQILLSFKEASNYIVFILVDLEPQLRSESSVTKKEGKN